MNVYVCCLRKMKGSASSSPRTFTYGTLFLSSCTARFVFDTRKKDGNHEEHSIHKTVSNKDMTQKCKYSEYIKYILNVLHLSTQSVVIAYSLLTNAISVHIFCFFFCRSCTCFLIVTFMEKTFPLLLVLVWSRLNDLNLFKAAKIQKESEGLMGIQTKAWVDVPECYYDLHFSVFRLIPKSLSYFYYHTDTQMVISHKIPPKGSKAKGKTITKNKQTKKHPVTVTQLQLKSLKDRTEWRRKPQSKPTTT